MVEVLRFFLDELLLLMLQECGVYHEKCIKQYLRGCSGKNYDP